MSFAILVGALALTPTPGTPVTCAATPFKLHKEAAAPAVATPVAKPPKVAAAKPAPKPKPKAKIGCKSG